MIRLARTAGVRHALTHWVRLGLIPAGIATVIIVGIGYAVEVRSRTVFQKELSLRTGNQLELIAARMISEINTSVVSVRGLTNVITDKPGISMPTLAQHAQLTLRQNPSLMYLALAPAGIVRVAYPASQMREVLNTDLLQVEHLRAAVAAAQSTMHPMTTGPARLASGKSGFYIIVPVAGWGVVLAMVDETKLYAAAGLSKPGKGLADRPHRVKLDVAMRTVPVGGLPQQVFFGPADIFERVPQLRSMAFMGGTWDIAGVPTNGWNQPPPELSTLRLSFALTAGLMFLVICLIGGLLSERRRSQSVLKMQEDRVAALSQRLGLALEASRIGIWEIDTTDWSMMLDDRMAEFHNQPKGGEFDYKSLRPVMHPEDAERLDIGFRVAAERELGETLFEYRVITPDDGVRYLRSVGTSHFDSRGRKKLTGLTWDITQDKELNALLLGAKASSDAKNLELEEAKNRIEHNALHDPLTGLGNRRKLDDALQDMAEQASLHSGGIAILHIDLDRFKQINDTLGHAAGDAMLVHASRILSKNVRATDLIARIGGDEFVVVITNVTSPQYLSELSERILVQMRQPVDYNGYSCRFGVSIGIAMEQDKGEGIDARQLLVNADIALYRAKENGRNQWQFFTEMLQAEIVTTKRIADEILGGIEGDQFVPYYQPQIEAGTLNLVGLEVLIRWNHPREGVLPPARFLKIAEDLNVMAALDRIMLEKALADRARWLKMGLQVPKISVNVSAKRLSDSGLMASLDGLLFQPGEIAFELLESIFLDDHDEVVTRNIADIKARGIDVELDDFGSGHSSIISLLKIKPRRLKIDRQLILPVLQSTNERALVRAIIEIGNSLGIDTVAEGIETIEHAEMLTVMGCHVLQGYAFSRPITAADFAALATREGWRMAS